MRTRSWRDTWDRRQPSDPPGHVVVVSDDGADTMLQPDEKGESGAAICARALERARAGGTLVLSLSDRKWAAQATFERLGWSVHRVTEWAELVQFARAFVRRLYAENR